MPANTESDPSDGLPPELAPLYRQLWQDVSWLHVKWEAFKAMYATRPDTVELLNRSASSFFGMLQDMLFDDVLLSISRLTDPKGRGTKQNLTLEQLAHAVDATTYPEVRREAETRLRTATDNAADARAIRNKRIAHADLGIALRHPASSLPAVSRASIERALEAIREFMQIFSLQFQQTTVVYEHPFTGPGDVHGLLHALRDADRLERARHKGDFIPPWDP